MPERKKAECKTDAGQVSLIDAVNQVFYSVLVVHPQTDLVLILQSHDFPEEVQAQMGWDEYLARYSKILTEEGYGKLKECLSSQALLETYRSGKTSFSLDVSYRKGEETNWITISVLLKETGDTLQAYVFVRLANEEHLLKSIIDLYVYNTCDYFIYLNARENSYVMFSGSSSGTPLPPEICNDYATALVDYARDYVVPEDQEMVIREMQIDRVLQQLDLHGVHSFYCGVIEEGRGYTRKQLTYRYYDRGAQMVLLSRTDVTEVYLEEQMRQKELMEAYRQSETDTLTGLLNEKGLQSRVKKALTAGEKAALLFLDLDNFKQVNDSLGHMEGNRLLCQIAKILREQTEEKDLQARIGGDEFVVFLDNIQDEEEAKRYAKGICEAVRRLSTMLTDAVPVSCSIGIALAPKDGNDYATLFVQADQLAYRAKAEGKNRYALL